MRHGLSDLETAVVDVLKDERYRIIATMMKKARKAAQEAQELESFVFDEIAKVTGDLDLSLLATDAENAGDVHEAIACYLSYGEYNIDGLIKEIKNPVFKEDISPNYVK